jgi:hypothetical protein
VNRIERAAAASAVRPLDLTMSANPAACYADVLDAAALAAARAAVVAARAAERRATGAATLDVGHGSFPRQSPGVFQSKGESLSQLSATALANVATSRRIATTTS